MIERGALQIMDLIREDLSAMHGLMRKYRDQPMDFADASLVQVATRPGLTEVFTLDRRDFGVLSAEQESRVQDPGSNANDAGSAAPGNIARGA
jgi:predicted nucleic acid-binding protein